MFDSILNEGFKINFSNVLICTFASLVLGIVLALVYMKAEKHYTRNYAVSLILMPVIVCAVISIVNGNLGAGIAVMGAFGLVRFRSQPGNAKEIAVLFSSMVAGLICASGYLFYAVVFELLVIAVLLILSALHFGGDLTQEKMLKITIPENLDYTDAFDDIFKKYTKSSELETVKTTNLGSMYELRYEVVLKEKVREKDMIDEIRTRNANLPIVLGRKQSGVSEL